MLDYELNAVLSDNICIKNIVDSPPCICSDKDTHHILFVCHHFKTLDEIL